LRSRSHHKNFSTRCASLDPRLKQSNCFLILVILQCFRSRSKRDRFAIDAVTSVTLCDMNDRCVELTIDRTKKFDGVDQQISYDDDYA
jgi:hypothetical protein